MSNPQTSPNFKTSIGGQALMEGIMMRGPQKICCAVRKPDGTIDLSYDTVTTHWYNRVPLVRGVCNMAENLYKGYHYLMHAADLALQDDEEPQSRADRWLENHPGVQNVMMALSAFAGVALALFLFTFLPTFLTGLLPLGRWPRVVLEGVLKMGIFLLYMYLCTRMKELHRVFEYHGAEHKTIACYEAGEELTVENEQLKEELAKAKSEATMYQNQITELANLQKLYEIDEIYEDYEKTAANVFAKDTTSWFSTFYIDKGTEDGVFEGANILCQDGLCGIVLESYDDYSKVRAIIDDNSKVSAKVLPSNALCTVDGNLSLYQNGYLIAKNIDKDAAIAVGDKIVTSQISDRFLPGITVGYIKEISLDSNNLTVTAYITPAADFDNISQVLIINEKKKTIIQEDK